MTSLSEIKKKLNEQLGYGPCFGSKSAYHIDNPEALPFFNANIYVMINNHFKDESCLGELRAVWFGDIDVKDPKTVESLINFSVENKVSLYIYRESTKNNAIFNGRMFPYNQYDAKIEYFGQNNSEFSIT